MNVNFININSYSKYFSKIIQNNDLDINILNSSISNECNFCIILHPFDNFINYLNYYYEENNDITIDDFIDISRTGFIRSQIINDVDIDIYKIDYGIQNIIYNVFKKNIKDLEDIHSNKYTLLDFSEIQLHEIYYIFKDEFLKYNFKYKSNYNYNSNLLNCFVYLKFNEKNQIQKEIYNHNLNISKKYNFNYLVISELTSDFYLNTCELSEDILKIQILNNYNGVLIHDNIILLNNLNVCYLKLKLTINVVYIISGTDSKIIFYIKNIDIKNNENLFKNDYDGIHKKLIINKKMNIINDSLLDDISMNNILVDNFYIEYSQMVKNYKEFLFLNSINKYEYTNKFKNMYVGCFDTKNMIINIKICGIHPYFIKPIEDKDFKLVYRSINHTLLVQEGYNFIGNNIGKIKCTCIENAKTILSTIITNNLFFYSTFCNKRKTLWIKNNIIHHPSTYGRQINKIYPDCVSIYLDKDDNFKKYVSDYPGNDLNWYDCNTIEEATEIMINYKKKINNKKLIINSYKNYNVAHLTIFHSLIDIGFTHFNKIILILGGCDIDEDPDIINLQDLGLSIDREITLIKVKINNYDLNGFYALNKYKNHELVKSNYYIYILDTCTFTHMFNEIFNYFILNDKNLFITSPPGSCLMIFSYKFILLYKTNFDTILGKTNGLFIEHGINIKINDNIINSYYNFQKPMYYTKIEGGLVDIYMTGYDRTKNYYPFLGIHKYVFLHLSGDISGEIAKNISSSNRDLIKYNMKKGMALMKNLRNKLFK